jgi:hypothetical protein
MLTKVLSNESLFQQLVFTVVRLRCLWNDKNVENLLSRELLLRVFMTFLFTDNLLRISDDDNWLWIDHTIDVQEDEVTEELLNFHEAVNHMQEQEEELIDYHHQLAEVSSVDPVNGNENELLSLTDFLISVNENWNGKYVKNWHEMETHKTKNNRLCKSKVWLINAVFNLTCYLLTLLRLAISRWCIAIMMQRVSSNEQFTAEVVSMQTLAAVVKLLFQMSRIPKLEMFEIVELGALAPQDMAQPCWGRYREGVAPSRHGGPGYNPRKIFKILIAKSCILVYLWISILNSQNIVECSKRHSIACKTPVLDLYGCSINCRLFDWRCADQVNSVQTLLNKLSRERW